MPPLPFRPGGARRPRGRRRKRTPRAAGPGVFAGDELGVPAMTDFRAGGTILGPAGLTAVFGMGTGRTPPVWSPGKRPAGGRGRAGRTLAVVRSSVTQRPGVGVARCISATGPSEGTCVTGGRTLVPVRWPRVRPRIGVVKSLGCWDWSAAAVARRALPAHRPGRLPGAFGGPQSARKPGFEDGFALRCLQRLSGPDLATRRCPERDSRHTRGRSSPILSY